MRACIFMSHTRFGRGTEITKIYGFFAKHPSFDGMVKSGGVELSDVYGRKATCLKFTKMIHLRV